MHGRERRLSLKSAPLTSFAGTLVCTILAACGGDKLSGVLDATNGPHDAATTGDAGPPDMGIVEAPDTGSDAGVTVDAGSEPDATQSDSGGSVDAGAGDAGSGASGIGTSCTGVNPNM